MVRICEPAAIGSSPLARGLLLAAPEQVQVQGIIPARAGFTLGGEDLDDGRADHPRSRGVYARRLHAPVPGGGSSPLARGLPGRPGRRKGNLRIIPARAGFTAGDVRRQGRQGDHPRSRGVYTRAICCPARTLGSSPLARGLQPGHRVSYAALGIIPARAGFTPRSPARDGAGTDHPRSRGVYAAAVVPAAQEWGSSPLARGLLDDHAHVPDPARIIPARAGFTSSSGTGRTTTTDHPRSRGVYQFQHPFVFKSLGSSPLARGLRDQGGPDRHGTGIIPARAGFTGEGHGAHGVPPDHPRSRGVYGRSRRTGRPTAGSSPLARGLPLH